MITESPDLAIMQLLRNAADVTSLVDNRIFPQYAPGRARMPYIIVTAVTIEPDKSLNGSVGLWRANIQVDGYTASYVQNRALARAVAHALHGRPNPTYVTVPDDSGANPDEVFTLQLVQLEADNSDFFQPTDGSDEGVRRFSHDYRVAYNVAEITH